MDTITGLPAHPLLVHLPIVAIPLAAILVLLFALKPSWRSMLDYFLIAMGGAVGLGVVLAASSGESLDEKTDESAALSAHTALGDQMQTIGVIFGLALIALGLYHLITRKTIYRVRDSVARPLLTAIMVGTIVIASVAVVWDVRTGHSGAKSAWGNEDRSGQSSDGGDDDDAEVPPQVGWEISGSSWS